MKRQYNQTYLLNGDSDSSDFVSVNRREDCRVDYLADCH